MNDQIIFTDVQPIDIHFRILYSSLSQRLFKISHESTPSFDEHIKFVSNHPYRIWVIIEMNQKLLGNCYIHSDNSIGVNIDEEHSECLPEILQMICKMWKPLPPIPSVRNKNFFINIAATNDKLIAMMEKIDLKHIQNSYLLK